jgi:hypothetical protein
MANLFCVGIGTAHFGAGFGGCEHPFDAGGSGVSLSFPRGDFANGAFRVVDSAVQALTAHTPISISTMLSQLACLGV